MWFNALKSNLFYEFRVHAMRTYILFFTAIFSQVFFPSFSVSNKSKAHKELKHTEIKNKTTTYNVYAICIKYPTNDLLVNLISRMHIMHSFLALFRLSTHLEIYVWKMVCCLFPHHLKFLLQLIKSAKWVITDSGKSEMHFHPNPHNTYKTLFVQQGIKSNCRRTHSIRITAMQQ